MNWVSIIAQGFYNQPRTQLTLETITGPFFWSSKEQENDKRKTRKTTRTSPVPLVSAPRGFFWVFFLSHSFRNQSRDIDPGLTFWFERKDFKVLLLRSILTLWIFTWEGPPSSYKLGRLKLQFVFIAGTPSIELERWLVLRTGPRGAGS